MNSISHNLMALNTQRQFHINSRFKIKSTEKLSSGYQINRAADDAASLSISEKMRHQIRGLNQGISNTENAIGLIKTADGNLQEIHNIIGRMRELTIKAANDVNAPEDRQTIQNEINSLYTEIDDIAHKTQFNGKYPLIPEVGGDFEWVLPSSLSPCAISISNTSSSDLVVNRKTLKPNKTIAISGISYDNFKNGNFIYDLGGNASISKSGYTISLDGSNSDILGLSLNSLKLDDDGYIYFTSKQDNTDYYLSKTTYSIYNNKTGLDETLSGIGLDTSSNGDSIRGSKQYYKRLWIQSGTSIGDGMYVKTVDATTSGLGLTPLDVLSNEAANTSLHLLDYATKKTSEYRSLLGAQQNRLEFTLNANANYVENLTNAESTIRDTDIATELLSHSKHNILEQVIQSILAQANQANSSILQILQ